MTDFIHVMAAAVERYETKSLVKYPTWEKLSNKEQVEAVFDELEEWGEAVESGDVHGEHGEISEAIDCIAVLARRIMELSK